MKKFVLAAVAAFGLVGAASAADMPTKAPVFKAPGAALYNWTGFYVGGNLGWGWNSDDGQQLCTDPTGASFGPGCAVVGNAAHINADGFIGGGQIGYNWQVNQWVIGVETDLQGADIHGANSALGPFPLVGGGNSGASSYAVNETLRWFGTLRGRAGFAWDRVLLYATGGLAYGGASVNSTLTAFGTTWPASASETKTGWAVGGGLEYAFLGNWSGKIEGLYYDLGTIAVSTIGAPVPNGYTSGKNFEFRGGIVRAGINYHFN